MHELVQAGLISDSQFGRTLKRILESRGISVSQFSSRTGISIASLYKLIQGARSPTLRTLRKILAGFTELEKAQGFIGVIASKHVLHGIPDQIRMGSRSYQLRKYPVESAEQAIIAGVNAEKQGARAIICAPILAETLSRLVSIPVIKMLPRPSVIRDSLKRYLAQELS